MTTEAQARLARSIIARIEGDMAVGIPFANAIQNARRRAIGGPEVWALVEAYFREADAAVDSMAAPL